MSEAISADHDELAVVETADDVAVVKSTSRDPDTIVSEIEQTRAELASTIDAIADRISPKRAAARGVSAVRSAPVPVVPIAAAAGVVAVVVVVVRRRRRR